MTKPACALFTLTAVIVAVAGALYYPQAGIINPAELAPIASIYLAVWVTIGGRGHLYAAVIGAAVVSLLSSRFTGGRAPSIPLGFLTINWVDWWQVLLGATFVCVTLFAPKGIGGLFDYFTGIHSPDRKGAPLGPAELRAIIGPNGAGKSTFMDIVTGKTKPDSGSVTYGEKSTSLLKLSESKIARAGVGRKFQRPTVFEDQTATENLTLALKAARSPWRPPNCW